MERTCDVEWRLASAIYSLSLNIEDGNERMDKLIEGFELAKSAFEKDPKSANAAKRAALLVGFLSECAPTTHEQMKYGAQFKKYLDHSIELEPELSFMVRFMRGRFSFTVASLSWLERAIASKVFDYLPTCTYDDALKDLLAYEKFAPTITTLLFIGKTYLGKGDKDKAREYLKRAIECQGESVIDEENIEEAKKILADL